MKRTPIEVVHFTLKDEHIALCDLLKVTGIVNSGGDAKNVIAQGYVSVDDQPESRKSAKIRGGQKIKLPGVCILTHAAPTV